MLTCVAQERAVGEVAVAAQDDPRETTPLKLSHRICPTGETVVDLGGELDCAGAEAAVCYVRDVIDRHPGPVIVDLAALVFCDARGLAALVCMAGYAEQKSCPFRLASPSPSLVKIMRITGLDRRFLTSQASALDGKVARARTLMREIDGVLKRRPDLGTLVSDAQEHRVRLARERGSDLPGASAMTTAELRVLPLLTTHLSFREIGAELFLSPNTIKSQAISIYRKLGAATRSQAVTRARELGLLEG